MATIKEVAALAGVTPTTVSRCLNNRGYISDSTRQKIEAAMDELGYRPNALAQALSKQTTNTIAVLVPHISHPYFASLISMIERSAHAMGYKIFLMSSRDNEEKKDEYLKVCLDNRVSGIIICSQKVDGQSIRKYGIPVVQIETAPEKGIPHIVCDNWTGGQMAAKALIDAGCRKLLHIGGVETTQAPADERAKAFAGVCEQAGVEHKEVSYSVGVYKSMDYTAYINEVLEQNPEVDGIFTSSDLIAVQICQAAFRMGRRIPEDLKLIGFDDVFVSEMSNPPISSIRQPLKAMAQRAVELIDAMSKGEACEMEHVFPVELVWRESLGEKQ